MKQVLQTLAMATALLLIPVTSWAQGSLTAQVITDTERSILFPSRKMIEFGRTAAEANCASCHGMDGISDSEGKPHLAGQRTVYLFRVLNAFQSGKRSDVQNNHNDFLNEQVLLSTAVYYASLAPVQIVAHTETAETAGVSDTAELSDVDADDPFFGIRDSMRRCIKCHGETGNAPGSGMPNLTGQDPEYFRTSMLAYVDGSRSHTLMKKLVGGLDEETIKAMGVFYAVQEPMQSETQGEGDANVGRRLSKDCESCHGDNGNPKNASMPTIAGQDAKYFIKAMTHYKNGERQHQKMFDAVVNLSEQDMSDLATYYAAEQPRRRDVRSPLKSTEWITRCERCHGIDGNSSDPRFPMLAGQDLVYLKMALEAYVSGARENTTMHAMADPLSAMDIERIGVYFASQQPKAVVYMQLPCGDDQRY